LLSSRRLTHPTILKTPRRRQQQVRIYKKIPHAGAGRGPERSLEDRRASNMCRWNSKSDPALKAARGDCWFDWFLLTQSLEFTVRRYPIECLRTSRVPFQKSSSNLPDQPGRRNQPLLRSFNYYLSGKFADEKECDKQAPMQVTLESRGAASLMLVYRSHSSRKDRPFIRRTGSLFHSLRCSI